jgi:hypothetical protein
MLIGVRLPGRRNSTESLSPRKTGSEVMMNIPPVLRFRALPLKRVPLV